MSVFIGIATVAATQHHFAFSCDSNSTYSNNLYSAASIGRATGAAASCAACPGPADVLSCFTSPADVWSLLQPLPSGRRAISLEGLWSPYYCADAQGKKYWQDTLGDGSTLGPWGDQWAAEVAKRFDAWFGEYLKIGGSVDHILSDFEMGGHAYWYAFAMQPQHSGRPPQEALVSDKRWPALRHRLNALGVGWNVSFNNLSDMQSWTVHDPRASVWDLAVVDGMLGEYLNASVFRPIAAHFPGVRFSNFAHAHHTDPTGVAGAPPANGWWPHKVTSARTPLGTGSHVGTAQSTSIYGATNDTTVLTTNTMSRVRTRAASPFDVLLGNQAMLRDMRVAAPAVPIEPWVCPKQAAWGHQGSTPHASWLGGSDMWQENVLHAAVAVATRTFLWWRPGAQRPDDLGFALMSTVLVELDDVLGGGGAPAGKWTCDVASATPIDDGATSILGADDPYLLSGTELSCVGGAHGGAPAVEGGTTTTRRVYRLTPRCLDAPRDCATRPSASALAHGARATIKIASGFEVTPVADGCWWSPGANTSAAGFWVVAPC